MDKQLQRWTVVKTSVNRRTLLKASAGSMAAMAVHSAYTMDALAQENPALSGLEFFTDPQAETINAIAEQMWPTTEDSPGGRDAGVLYYIDQALAGAYEEYQPVYRAGIEWLDQAASAEYNAVFRELESDQQNALMTAAYGAEDAEPEATPVSGGETGQPVVEAAGATPVAVEAVEEGQPIVAGVDGPTIASLPDFLEIVRRHTMEGLFSDPIYGGNRDFAGWRAVGYPGPYYIYTEEEQQSFEPLDKPFQSIADL